MPSVAAPMQLWRSGNTSHTHGERAVRDALQYVRVYRSITNSAVAPGANTHTQAEGVTHTTLSHKLVIHTHTQKVMPRASARVRWYNRSRSRRKTALIIDPWLILPVVICLSQRLSHACLSTSCVSHGETADGSLNQSLSKWASPCLLG